MTWVVALWLVAIHAFSTDLMRAFGAISWQGLTPSTAFRPFSAVVLHADLAHLAGNLLLLVLMGWSLERRVGHALVMVFLLGSGLVGALGSAVLSGELSVGVSGAVYGLLGAWAVLGGEAADGGYARPQLSGRLWVLLAVLLLVDNLRPAIDWAAHLSGGVTGAWLASRVRASGVRLGAPAWARPVAAALGAVFVSAWVWAGVVYERGGPELVGQLPDGPVRAVLTNNLAFVAAIASDPDRDQLERWRELMAPVVRSHPESPEFKDTLATLHHRLGDDAAAMRLERELSWAHESPFYMGQFARFAWSASRANRGGEGNLELPREVALRIARERDAWVLRLSPDRIAGAGLEVDALLASRGEPLGLLRLELPPGPAGSSRLPFGAFEGGSGERVDPPEVRVVSVHSPDAPPAARSIRYWPVPPAYFEPYGPDHPVAQPQAPAGPGRTESGGPGV